MSADYDQNSSQNRLKPGQKRKRKDKYCPLENLQIPGIVGDVFIDNTEVYQGINGWHNHG
jgi:hypothetical protein